MKSGIVYNVCKNGRDNNPWNVAFEISAQIWIKTVLKNSTVPTTERRDFILSISNRKSIRGSCSTCEKWI